RGAQLGQVGGGAVVGRQEPEGAAGDQAHQHHREHLQTHGRQHARPVRRRGAGARAPGRRQSPAGHARGRPGGRRVRERVTPTWWGWWGWWWLVPTPVSAGTGTMWRVPCMTRR